MVKLDLSDDSETSTLGNLGGVGDLAEEFAQYRLLTRKVLSDECGRNLAIAVKVTPILYSDGRSWIGEFADHALRACSRGQCFVDFGCDKVPIYVIMTSNDLVC